MKESYVFDASALIDFSEAGPGMRKVEQLLQAAARQQAAIFVSVMNLGEVFYWTWQKRDEAEARRAVDSLSKLPIDYVSVDLAHAIKAGEIKALHHMSYGLRRGGSSDAESSHARHRRSGFRKARPQLSGVMAPAAVNGESRFWSSERRIEPNR